MYINTYILVTVQGSTLDEQLPSQASQLDELDLDYVEQAGDVASQTRAFFGCPVFESKMQGLLFWLFTGDIDVEVDVDVDV